MITCPECGFTNRDDIKYCRRCNRYIGSVKPVNQDININNILSSSPTIECPYCHSTNTHKISGLSKAGSVALWGIFAMGKTSKQWHCDNCKSDF